MRLGEKTDVIHRDIGSVDFVRDRKSAGQFGRTGKVNVPVIQWPRSADEQRFGVSFFAHHNVEHPVHSINEIHVRAAGRTEHDFGARGAAFGGMRSEVFWPEVSFHLDDACAAKRARDVAHHDGSNKRRRGDQRGLAEERVLEFKTCQGRNPAVTPSE